MIKENQKNPMETCKVIVVPWDIAKKSPFILHMHTHTFIPLKFFQILYSVILLWSNKQYVYIWQ